VKLDWIFKAIVGGIVYGLAQSAIEKMLSGTNRDESGEAPARKKATTND